MADRAAILQIAQRSIEKNAEEREASTKAKLHALEVELTGLRAERGTMSASLSTQAAQILQLREALANLVEDLRIARKPVLDADAVEGQDAREAPRQTLDAEPQGPTRAGKSALRLHQEPAAMSFSSLARNSSRFSRVTTVGSTVSVPPSGSTLSSPAWRPFRMRTEW